MDVSVDERWQTLIDDLVREGRYPSAEEVVGEGLRLVEEQEAKLAELRAMIQRSLDDSAPPLTEEEMDAALEEEYARLAAEGY